MKKKEVIFPKGAWITVNRNCNLRCKWCYAQGTEYDKESEMSLDFAKEIILLIKSLNIKNVIVIGGEPTLWPYLIEFNQFCKSLDIKTTLVTNAIKFSDDSFWESYKQNSNTRVGISIKAYDVPSFKEACGVSNIDRVKLGIKRTTELFGKCGVSFVYNSFIKDNLINTAKFAIENGAKYVSISPCVPTFNGDSIENKYSIELNEFISDFMRDYKILSDVTKNRLYLSMKIPFCLWPKDFIEELLLKKQISSICQVRKKSGIIFDTDGKILMCNNLFSYPMGIYKKDFTDKDSVISLLNSPTVTSYYERINSYPSLKCISCSKYQICAGGCPLIWSIYDPKIIKGWDC